jgi:hypothetical protein
VKKMIVELGHIKIGPEDAAEVARILKLADATPGKFSYMALGPLHGHIGHLRLYQEFAKQGYDEYESYRSY